MTVTATEPDFEPHRARLVGMAYRITGSRSEAEDIVQDAWLRWQSADRAAIDRPAAWLTTVTSRLALDRLKSARHRREVYVGPWLPEPVADDPTPGEHLELAESLTIGFLTMLERLTPTERVVFLLADIFQVPFEEVAEAVDKSPAACRQIASRARRRVRDDRPRFTPTDDEAWLVANAFLGASQASDLDTLIALLADDALVVSDGGADHHAARRPIIADRAPRYLVNLARRSIEPGDPIEVCSINGQPGAIVTRDGQPFLALVLDVGDGLVRHVWIMVNLDKLTMLPGPRQLPDTPHRG